MVLAVLPLILGITFIIVLLGKEKFGCSVPVSIILSSLLLYFSQILFETFSVGLIAFVLTGLIGCLLAIVSFLRVKSSSRLKETIMLYFSPGFYAFLVVFFFALIAYSGRHFSAWDELSHWGPMVKEMLRLDKFYIVPEARQMAHKDYAPIIQLFEYLMCWFSGGYSEGKASIGIQILMLSFVAPVFMEKVGKDIYESTRRKLGVNLILGLLTLILTVLLFLWFDGSDIYRTIMTDCAVCAVGVYTLILSLDEDIIVNKTKKIFLIITLFYLPLCKQIALAFVLLAYFALILTAIQGKTYISEKKRTSLVFFVLTVFVTPLLSLKLWSCIIKPYDFSVQFDLGRISMTEVIMILVGKGNWTQTTTYIKYVTALIYEPITNGPIALSYVTLCVLALFLLSAFYFSKRTLLERISINEYIKYLLVFVSGIIGYAFTMFVMYMYGFSEGEMLGLASFSRYMSTYVSLMYFLLMYLFLSKLDLKSYKSNESVNKYLILMAVTVMLLILVDQNRLTDFLPQIYRNETREYQELACDIDNHVEYNETVLLVSDNNNMYYPFLRYYCDDAVLSGKEYWEGVPEEELASFDYVYIINVNDYQNEQWRRMLEHPEDTIQPGAYAVENIDGMYKLRFVK